MKNKSSIVFGTALIFSMTSIASNQQEKIHSAIEVNNPYNQLQTVFDADSSLQQKGRDAIIEEIIDVIMSFGLQNSVGLRLLHRHNAITVNEVMLEDARFDEHGIALVTLATPVEEIDSTVCANSWMLDGDNFIPCEYSRKSLLKYPDITPNNNQQFFRAMGQKLRQLQVEKWIGPALIESNLVSSYAAGRELLLEQSALDDRANVLRYVSTDETNPSGFVETFWVASARHAAAKASGSSKKAKKKRVCKRICPRVQNPPVHQGTYIHNS